MSANRYGVNKTNLSQSSHTISKKNSDGNDKGKQSALPLANSTVIQKEKKLSDPSIDPKIKSSNYPSELKPLETLISKTNLKFSKQQLEKYLFFRETGTIIYEAISYYYVEEIFKSGSIQYITTWIELLKGPDYHILTNPFFANKNKKISIEMKQKYLKAHQNLIILFESYLDILLNDQSKRYDVIYDYYSQCSLNESIKLASSLLIRNVTAGYYSSHKKTIVDSYKIFNIDDLSATKADYDLITYATDFVINIYTPLKNGDVKCEIFSYGVEKAISYIKVLSNGISFYNLYEKDQKTLLEKRILEGVNKNLSKNEENIKPSEKMISNKQERPDINNNHLQKPIIEESKANTNSFNGSKKCDRCKSEKNVKPLFLIKPCNHSVCFDCMISKYLAKTGSYYQSLMHDCPLYSCSSRFTDDEIQEYFNQIQISESLTMSTAVTEKTDVSIPESKMENILEKNEEECVINLEPKVKCCTCHKDTPQSEIFTNPECYHCFCHDCLCKKYSHSKYYNFCPVRVCNKYLHQKSIEKFLIDYVSRDSKKNMIEVQQICYSCSKKFKISIGMGTELDFFHCTSCKVTSCLIHCAPLNKCFCFCENCNIKTEPDWIKPSCRYCPDCKRKFCLLCQDSIVKCNCYCKKCEAIISKPEKENLCPDCKEACTKCGMKTVKRSQIYGKCGHLYCKSCILGNMNEFESYGCLKKNF